MIDFYTPDSLELLFRVPQERTGFTSGNSVLIPATPSQMKLENDLATFVFETNSTSGFRLASFTRKTPGSSANTWVNVETNPWQLIVIDVSLQKSLNTSMVIPLAAEIDSPQLSANSLKVVWPEVIVGGVDSLSVTINYELRPGEDWLRWSMTVAWNGTPTKYAVDSFCATPLRIQPLNRGQDEACFPAVFGIASEDPITNLRYDPADGRTAATFQAYLFNIFMSPIGPAWRMNVFGYYEKTGLLGAGEAWSTWIERWDGTLTTITFQSDGENMLHEAYVQAENSILVGNAGSPMSMTGGCLRALRTTSMHGWWDIAAHYRHRIEEVNPPCLVKKRADREDLDPIERKPFLFIDLLISGYSGSTLFLADQVPAIRAKLGLPDDTPIFGTVEPNDNLRTVFEDPVGDTRQTLGLLLHQNVFIANWYPGIKGPANWAPDRWANNELRFWTDLEVIKTTRQSRNGRFLGDPDANLSEDVKGNFYFEKIYTVTGYDSLTNRVSISADPTIDPDLAGPLNFLVTLVPANPLSRMGRPGYNSKLPTNQEGNSVVAFGNGYIDVTGPFIAGDMSTVTPQVGDFVTVISYVGANAGIPWFCPYAAIHSSAFIDMFALNTTVGAFVNCNAAGQYFDVYPDSNNIEPVSQLHTCYRDHSSWSKLDPGYVGHPLGGGSWWRDTNNKILGITRQRGRDAMQASLGFTAFMQSAEYIDEFSQDTIDFSWHVMREGVLWRNNPDPTIDRFKVVPLYSTVHAGRTFCRALLHEFSSGMLKQVAHNDSLLHESMAFELMSEWFYGVTIPTLSLYTDDQDGPLDLWDDSQYQENGGTASNRIRQIRDLWGAMAQATVLWLYRYMPNGDALPPAVVDFNVTDTTESYSSTLYLGPSYNILYPQHTFPKVLQMPWRARDDGSVCVLMGNWTKDNARWGGTLPLDAMGLRGGAGITAIAVDAKGDEFNLPFTFDEASGRLDISVFPASSIAGIILTIQQLPHNVSILADQNVEFTDEATQLDTLEMFAADSMHLRYRIFDLRSDPTGKTPLDLSGVTAKWSLARKNATGYSKKPTLDKRSGADVTTSGQEVASVNVAFGGSGYTAGETLQVLGGDGVGALVQVVSVGGIGEILSVKLVDPGSYITVPEVVSALAGGSGSAALVSLGFRGTRGTVLVRLRSADTVKLTGDWHQELELFDADLRSDVVAVGDVTIQVNVVNT